MAKERLIKSVSTTSDSQGRGTFTLGPAEQGYVYEGSVQVPNAPAGALFVATVLTTNWGQWAGPTNYGPIQLYGGEFLTVTATGLNPSTSYVLTIFGVWGPEEEFDPKPPAAPESVVSVETATLLVNGAVPAGSPNRITNIRPPSLTRRVTVVGTGFGVNTIYSLTGDQTGTLYGLFNPGLHVPQFAAIEPTIDQTYTLTYISGSGASGAIWVLASFTNPLVDTNPASPIIINNAFGTFNQNFGTVNLSYNTANQLLIAAQGTLLCIYLQSITISNVGANGPVKLIFHDSTPGTFFANMEVPASGSDTLIFPGGFKLPANTGLQVDTTLATSGTSLIANGTFAVNVAL